MPATTLNELRLITLYCINGLYIAHGRNSAGQKVGLNPTEAEAEQIQLDRDFGPRHHAIGGWKIEEAYSPDLGLRLILDRFDRPTIVDPNGAVWEVWEACSNKAVCVTSVLARYPGTLIDPTLQRFAS